MNDGLGFRPLTARSVILSVLLGSHPPLLPVRVLVRTAELFDISEGTTRVALSRLVSDGDVIAEDSSYRLSSRLLSRQQRQDESIHPGTRAWRGVWEVAVARPDVRGAPERAALSGALRALRLAEIRPGVWVRPDNLVREWPSLIVDQTWRFEGRLGPPWPTGPELVEQLWDLEDWSRRAEELLTAMTAAKAPAERFTIAAAIVRLSRLDPLLPPALLPHDWPGRRLRKTYEAYEREMVEMMRRERARQASR